MARKFKKYFHITKVDVAARTVEGIMTSEAVDASREIMDWESSKPLFEKWSDELSKATGGANLGNVREMHGHSAAGKLVDIDFGTPDTRTIMGKAEIVDDSAWDKVLKKVYTGFSIGGNYVKKWADPLIAGVRRFTADPVEVSLVDLPCNPEAFFLMRKADGTEEQVTGLTDADVLAQFHEAQDMAAVEALVATYLTKFAPAVEALDEDEQLAKRLLARPEAVSVATALNAMLKEDERATLEKGLWTVADLASLLQSLRNICQNTQMEADMEGDNSPVPAKLWAAFKQLGETFLEYAAEEMDEATAMKLRAGELEKARDAASTELETLRKDRDALVANVTELTTERDALRKRVEQLGEQPAAPKGPLHVVSRDGSVTKLDDGVEDEIAALKKKIDAMPEGEEKARELAKLSFRAGPAR